MMRALADNTHVSLVANAHSLVPAVLSCMLAEHVCQHEDEDTHWTFREFAAKLLLAVVWCVARHVVRDVVSGPGHLPVANKTRVSSPTSRPDACHVAMMMRVVGHLHDMWTQPEQCTPTHLYMVAFFVVELAEPANGTGNVNAVAQLLVPSCARVAHRLRAIRQSATGGVPKTQDRVASDRLTRLMAVSSLLPLMCTSICGAHTIAYT